MHSLTKIHPIKLSMYVCMSKLSKFVFATAIQLQPKNIKVKEKRSYPHRPTVREGTYTHFIKHLVQTNWEGWKKTKTKT